MSYDVQRAKLVLHDVHVMRMAIPLGMLVLAATLLGCTTPHAHEPVLLAWSREGCGPASPTDTDVDIEADTEWVCAA